MCRGKAGPHDKDKTGRTKAGKCLLCCRVVQARYRQTDKGKAKEARYLQTDKGKAAYARYNQSAKCRRCQLVYDNTTRYSRGVDRQIAKFNDEGGLDRWQ